MVYFLRKLEVIHPEKEFALDRAIDHKSSDTLKVRHMGKLMSGEEVLSWKKLGEVVVMGSMGLLLGILLTGFVISLTM